jgi:hypothetical protein
VHTSSLFLALSRIYLAAKSLTHISRVETGVSDNAGTARGQNGTEDRLPAKASGIPGAPLQALMRIQASELPGLTCCPM